MKTSVLASTLALVASAMAAEVTQFMYVTVDANGNTLGTYIPSTLLSVTRNQSNSSNSSSSSFSLSASVLSTVIVSTPSAQAYDVPAPSSSADPSPSVEVYTFTPSSSAISVQTPQAQAQAQAQAQSSDSSSDSSSNSNSNSGSSGSSSSSGGNSGFALSMLSAHNLKRAAHGASALSWSSQLESYAQAYADKFQCGGGLVHSGGPYGENLALGYSDASSAVEAWYSEGSGYDFSSCSVFDHFTQVIWKSTTQLGCAYKDCGGLYIICSYDPAGNFIGQGPQNLSP